MNHQVVKISDVKPNPKNPRVIRDHKFKKLVNSIIEFPDMLNKRPLVAFTDKDNKYVVLGGNMRLKALKELKYKEVPIILADEWTEEQKNQFLIKDNVGFGEWDWDILANEWDTELITEWGLDIPEPPDIDDGGVDIEGDFDDEGVGYQSQYGVIVICESEGTQESVFNDLTNMGFNCKIVVT